MTTLFTDDFQRADAFDLGANYTTNSFDGGSLAILVNAAVAGAGGSGTSDVSDLVTAVGVLADGYAEVTLGAVGTGGAGTGLGVGWRYSSVALTGYRLIANGTGWELGRIVAGSFTSLKTGATTFATGDKVRLTFSGSAYTIAKNGVTVSGGTGTDSSIATGTPAIAYSSTDNVNSSATFFEVGNLTAGGSFPPLPGSSNPADPRSNHAALRMRARRRPVMRCTAREFHAERGLLVPARRIVPPTSARI